MNRKKFILAIPFIVPNGCTAIDEIVKIDEQTILPETQCKNPILLLNNQGKNVGIVNYVDKKIEIYINTDQGTAYIENSDDSGGIGYDDGSGIRNLAVARQEFRELSGFIRKVRKIKDGYQGSEVDFEIPETNIVFDEIDLKNAKEQENPLTKDAFAVFRSNGQMVGHVYGNKSFIYIEINDGFENLSLTMSSDGEVIYIDNHDINPYSEVFGELFKIIKTFIK